MSEPLDWSGAAPRSLRFDDIYFSPMDGLAEARAVFLVGCGLPEAWLGRDRFTVGELGFGAGLNILALIDLWRGSRPGPGSRLHLFSVEAFPISRPDAERALSVWPELADLAAPLLAAWPAGRSGFHRIEWPDHGVILDLAILEAEAALYGWDGRADAWFLDGFAPSKNPAMWRPEVLNLLAARSAPDARAATFSVAGAVRRGLQDAGFAIERAPGFGRKKERLEARLQSPAMDAEARKVAGPLRIAIIGAGIAGAALARAFHRLGQDVRVFDQAGPGAGASGNACALVAPRLDAGLGPSAELHAQAFARAVQLYRGETPSAVIAAGAFQLAMQARDLSRFDKIAGWDGFDPGAVERLDASATASALCEPQASLALHLRDALVVEPQPILAAWLANRLTIAHVERLEPDGEGWRLIDAAGAVLMRADVVCLASGPGATRLAPGVRLRPVRGQVSFTDAVAFSGAPAAFGGYAIPMRQGVLFGATHDRDDWSEDVRAEDDDLNLRALAAGRPNLAEAVRRAPRLVRASLRAMSPDHMPLAGAVSRATGLFVLSGFGGRGFTLAPLLAEAVAAEALDTPSPLPRGLSALVDPGRFEES